VHNIISPKLATIVCCVFVIVCPASSAADEQLNNQLVTAAVNGQLGQIQWLLERGADINSSGPSIGNTPAGVTALSYAAAENHLKVVEYLILHGAEVNQADAGGGSPLIYAAWRGHTSVVKLLLKHGADTNASVNGRSALSMARDNGHTETVRVLQAR